MTIAQPSPRRSRNPHWKPNAIIATSLVRYGRTLAGPRWDPRRLLAVLAAVSALLFGSTALAGCQYGATTGLASPQASTQVGTSASPTPDPTPLATPAPVAVSPTPAAPIQPAPYLVQAPRTTAVAPAPASLTQESGSCDADYYRNSNGNCVHRPEQASAPPSGSTAQCADGTYSFSQHRQGTCSHHGGVAQWLTLATPAPVVVSPTPAVTIQPAPTTVVAPAPASPTQENGSCDAEGTQASSYTHQACVARSIGVLHPDD